MEEKFVRPKDGSLPRELTVKEFEKLGYPRKLASDFIRDFKEINPKNIGVKIIRLAQIARTQSPALRLDDFTERAARLIGVSPLSIAHQLDSLSGSGVFERYMTVPPFTLIPRFPDSPEWDKSIKAISKMGLNEIDQALTMRDIYLYDDLDARTGNMSSLLAAKLAAEMKQKGLSEPDPFFLKQPYSDAVQDLAPRSPEIDSQPTLKSLSQLSDAFQQQSLSSKQGFEYGQKFVSSRTGSIGSLVSANEQDAIFETLSGKRTTLPINAIESNQVKPPATLTDLKRGDGLIANKSDLRYTVMETRGDSVKLRGEDGTIKTTTKAKVPQLFKPNPLGFGTFPAITSGLLGTTGIIGGATAGKLLAKSLGANEDQQNIAAGVGGAIGGLTGVTTGYIGDGATMPTSFQDMAKRVMGVKSNSELGMAEQLSIFDPPKRKSGLLYLPNYLSITDQKDLLNDLRTVVRQSPLFTPTMSSGAPFRYKMTNIGDLGWNSDRQGYRYESKHPVTGQPYPEIPSSLRSMIDDLSGKFGEKIRPDAVLLNWYSDGAKLGLHVDNTEKVSKPVVSLSLGDRGVFAIDTTGSRDRSTAMRNLERINVNSGDAIVFGGDLRNAYHAVERIDAGTAPPELGLKNSGRINLTARQVNETGTKYMASNKKIADGSISTTVSESAAKPPKLTSDIIADYLERMGGQATLVKPDGSQYNPNRKGRVNIGDRMTTAEKFGQAADVGLSNEFQKLPEVHARFDDRQVALQVQKELATGRLTTQKFFESPDKAIADQAADEIRRSDGLLGRGESVEVRKLGKAYEVVAVKQYQPVPSRGNSAVRSYGLDNDPEGRFVAFNKPEEAYAAPKSLKELQAEARRLEASGTQALAPDTRAEFKPQAQSNWEKLELPARSPMTEQLLQVAAEPKAIAAQTLDTPSDAWKLPQAKEPKLPHFYAQMASGDNPLGTGSTVQSEYDRAKSAYQGYQRFGYAPPDVEFPKLRELTKLAESEGVKGDDALKAYIKGKQNAPLIEAGVLPKPELPMTARLGQEYISPKSGKVGAVESVGKKGVKLNVDGQAVPVEYQTLEKLKYTGNKGYGFATPAALRPVFGGFIGGTAGSMAFKQLAQAVGLNEDQQNAAAATGGLIGSFAGSAVTNLPLDTKLRVPTAREFAATMMGAPQQRGAGARLFDLASSESGAFSPAAIAPEVRAKIESFSEYSLPSGILAYDEKGSTTGINALLREQKTNMDRHVSSFDSPENRAFVSALQGDLEVVPTKPQITYRGMVEGATDFKSKGKGSGERLAESIGLRPDRSFYDKGFMATTPSRDYADRYGKDITLEVMGSAGYKMPTRHADMGGEVLYPAGNQFDVENYRVDGEKVTARLVDRNLAPDEVVDLKQSLLKRRSLAEDNYQIRQIRDFNKTFKTLEDVVEGRRYLQRMREISSEGKDAYRAFDNGEISEHEFNRVADDVQYRLQRNDIAFQNRFNSGIYLSIDLPDERDYRFLFDKEFRQARRSPDYTGKFQESAIANPNQFEYGQKFQSPRTGNVGSLVSVDGQNAVIQNIDGLQKTFPISVLKNELQIKAPATLTDLKRGDGLISNKTDRRYTVMGTTDKGVKLRAEDGTIVTARKSEVPELLRPNSLGFTAPAALRPVIGGFVGGTAGSALFKQLAKSAGLTEEQQNQAAATGGIIGSFAGSAATNLPLDTKLRVPTAREFAQTMMSAPQQRGAGARLFDLVSSESGAIQPANPVIMQRQADRLKAQGYDVKLETFNPTQGWMDEYVTEVQKAPQGGKNILAANAPLDDGSIRKRLVDAADRTGIVVKQADGSIADILPKPNNLELAPNQRLRGTAYVDPKTKAQTIAVDAAFPKFGVDNTIAHEMGHILAGHTDGSRGKLPSTLKELEANAVAYGVQKKLGVAGNPRLQDAYLERYRSHLNMRQYQDYRSQIGNIDSERVQKAVDAILPYSVESQRLVRGERSQPVAIAPEIENITGDREISREEFARRFPDKVSKNAPEATPRQSTGASYGVVERPVTIAEKKYAGDRQVEIKSRYDNASLDLLKVGNFAKSESGLTAKVAGVYPDYVKLQLPDGDFIEIDRGSYLQNYSPDESYLTPKSSTKSTVKSKSGFRQALDYVTDALYEPKKSSGGFNRQQPKQSTFIAESAVEAAAQASGATTGQVKAEIANQRATGQAPDLTKATEAVKPQPRSLKQMQQAASKAVSTPITGRIGRVGDLGIKAFDYGSDITQAAQTFSESANRGESGNVAALRAATSVGSAYGVAALANMLPIPAPARLALTVGGSIAAAVGADKAIDAAVGRDMAREEKYGKDLSKLGLAGDPDNELLQPFGKAGDRDYARAYGNALVNTATLNMSSAAPALGRSLANLANSQSIDNARYASERGQSIDLSQQVGAGRRQMTGQSSTVYRDRGDGVTEAIGRRRAFSDVESRVLALQNLANESGYEVPRTGKFDPKLSEALEKLGYSDRQIGDYIQGRSKTIGSPAAKQSNVDQAKQQFALRSKLGKVTSSQMSEALSAERKRQGLKGNQKLDQGTVDSVFSSLAGRSLSQMQGKPSFANKTFAKAGFGMK